MLILCLSMAMQNLLRCVGFSLIVVSKGYSVVDEHGLLIAAASHVGEHGL